MTGDDDALRQRAAGPHHLGLVDRGDGAKIHVALRGSLTRPTKISSSEDWSVLQVANAHAGLAQLAEQRGDAGALGSRVVVVDQLMAVAADREIEGGEAGRNGVEPIDDLQDEALLAELAHQLGFLLDQDHLAFVDDADAVGHLLGLFDVVRGEDDGDAGCAQRAHHLPHVLAQLDVDARRRLVEEQNLSAHG